MNRRSRSSLFPVLSSFALLLVLVLNGCAQMPGGSPGGKTGATYKIGFITSITGAASYLGEPERDAATMMQKQLDEQGGITGPDGVKHPVKILIQDTEGSGDVAVPVAKKLIDSEGVVALLGPATSQESMALIPVATEAQVPMISMASSSGIVKPVAERKWIFKVAQSNEHTAPWQVKYAKAKGLTKIANIYVNNSYGEDGAAAIRATAKAENVQIVLEDTFGAADTDMTALITKIKASEAQSVLVTAIPPAAAIFTKQYRELGLTQPLLQNSGIGNVSFVPLAGAANAEGVIFPIGKIVAVDALADSDPQKPVLKQFVADFQKAIGKAPNQFAAHGRDSLALVLNALKALPNGLSLADQRSKLRDGLEGTSGFVGVDGVFNLSATDHVGLSTKDVVLARITNGEFAYLPEEKW
jgi:branched-chain amino acid transport system substrate-binding protein